MAQKLFCCYVQDPTQRDRRELDENNKHNILTFFSSHPPHPGHIINMVRIKTCAVMLLTDMSSIGIELRSFNVSWFASEVMS